MPGFRILKHSGIHRYRTRALFRTLLRGTRHELLPETDQSLLQTAIKDKFHRNHHAQGHHIHDAAGLGHKVVRVLSTLQSSTVLTVPVKRLIALTNQIYPPRKIEKIQEARLEGRRKHEEKLARQAATEAREATKGWHVYDRPQPKENLSGRRKIPDFVTTGGLSFLRYAKPQPPQLSGMIRYKKEKTYKMIMHHRKLMDVDMWRAMDEDRWDKIVAGMCGQHTREDGGKSLYMTAMQEGIDYMADLIAKDAQNRKERADILFDVALKERELALKENAKEKKERKRMRREKINEEKAAAQAVKERLQEEGLKPFRAFRQTSETEPTSTGINVDESGSTTHDS